MKRYVKKTAAAAVADLTFLFVQLNLKCGCCTALAAAYTHLFFLKFIACGNA